MIRFKHSNRLKEIILPFIAKRIPLQHLTKYKYYGGLRVFYWHNYLKKSQWLTKEELSFYHEKKLLKIIKHCYKSVPYYRNLYRSLKMDIREIKKVSDLAALPVINKDTLKSNFKDFTADNFAKFHPVNWETGGSTGKPLYFYHDKNVRSLVGALGWRFQDWASQLLRDRFAMMRSPIGYREGKLDYQTGYKYDPLARMLEINTANLDTSHLKAALALIHEFKPSFLHSYPSIANILALFALRNPEFRIKLKAVLVGSEFLYPEMRKNIETAFACKVHNFYGMEEAVTFAMECEAGNMHTCPELGILEIIKNGKACAPGEVGEFVCTGLHNFSMPLIRYAMGDYGCFKDIECPCGRKSAIIEISGGRDKDLLVTRSGIVNILSHENISKKIRGIKEFKIIQESRDEIFVKIVKDFNYSEQDKEMMLTGLENLLGHDVKINFEFVSAIPRTPAGKYKFVESKIPIAF